MNAARSAQHGALMLLKDLAGWRSGAGVRHQDAVHIDGGLVLGLEAGGHRTEVHESSQADDQAAFAGIDREHEDPVDGPLHRDRVAEPGDAIVGSANDAGDQTTRDQIRSHQPISSEVQEH